MKDNNTPHQPLNFPALVKTQTADRGHVREAPVICLLITRLSTARLCEESNGWQRGQETDSEQGSIRVCFFLIWENLPAEAGRFCGRTRGSYPRAEPLLCRRLAGPDPSSHAQTWARTLMKESRGQVAPQSRGQKTEARSLSCPKGVSGQWHIVGAWCPETDVVLTGHIQNTHFLSRHICPTLPAPGEGEETGRTWKCYYPVRIRSR